MADEYRIGEIAAKAGITVDTMRYYEKLGVLPRARRSSGGFRQYGDERSVTFGSSSRRKVRDLLAVRLEDVDQRLAELREFRRTLRRHLDACEKALEDASQHAQSWRS